MSPTLGFEDLDPLVITDVEALAAGGTKIIDQTACGGGGSKARGRTCGISRIWVPRRWITSPLLHKIGIGRESGVERKVSVSGTR